MSNLFGRRAADVFDDSVGLLTFADFILDRLLLAETITHGGEADILHVMISWETDVLYTCHNVGPAGWAADVLDDHGFGGRLVLGLNYFAAAVFLIARRGCGSRLTRRDSTHV